MKKIWYLIFGLFLITACSENKSVEPKTEVQNLKIHFHYSFKNELNTFDQTFQKDLVMDGTIKVPFYLTQEEQNDILNTITGVDFYSFPDTIRNEPGPDGIIMTINPDPGRQFIRIEYQGKEKLVNWFCPLPQDNPNGIRLLTLQQKIIEIIESKPEYQALPPARGGYL